MLRMVWSTFKIAAVAGILIVGLISMLALYLLNQIPSDKQIRSCQITKLYQVNLCPESKSYVRLNETSSYLVRTVVISEDSRFWQHRGFDLVEIENSLKQNLEEGRFVRGGSTITQQLVKNMFLSKEKTISRKIQEAIITLRMEKVLTKKEILERYLNVVQFGKDLYGIKAASQFYFNKLPRELDLVESAFLAFLLPSPERYSRSFYKKSLTPFAKERIRQIITTLYSVGRVTDDELAFSESKIEFLFGPPPPVELGDLNEPELDEDAQNQTEEHAEDNIIIEAEQSL